MSTEINLAVSDREELIYLLTEAAEFEHSVMCTYLYAQWTLKREGEEGVTPEEQAAIERWRGQIRQVAMEEMLHLGLVNNLLASIGAAPHFHKPNFPVASGRFPAGLDLHLVPFNEDSVEHFTYLERPEEIEIEDGRGFHHESTYQRVVCSDLLTPTPRDYSSQGHLYHGIGQAFVRLAKELGEKGLFVGHGEAQLGSSEFPLPGLFPVHNVETALRALEEIVLQGEGAPAHRDDSHYARFKSVHEELLELKAARPEFEPAWNAAVNPVLAEYTETSNVIRCSNPQARRVMDLGNSVFGLMLHTLAQVSAPMPLPKGLRQDLSDASAELMRVTGVIGEAAARLPICPRHPGVTAGLSFAVPRSFGQLVQANAAQILAERTAELAAAAHRIGSQVELGGAGDTLDGLARRLAGLHEQYERNFTVVAGSPAPPEQPAACALPAARTGDGGGASRAPQGGCGSDVDEDNIAASDAIEIRFDTRRCIHSRFCVLGAPRVFLANVEGPWLHPENDSVEHLVHVAQDCPSGAITYRRLDGGADEQAPEVNTANLRQNGPYAFRATLRIEGQQPMYRATLCRCGQSKNKPFCDNSHIAAGFEATGEPETMPSEPLEVRGGALQVSPLRDGPLHVRGPLEICCGTGRTVTRTENVKLCRCGGSASKPFCDGTHARIGFRSEG